MRIAVLGTGLMGQPMAVRLLERGHEVTVYNRTRAKAEPLAERGAEVVDTPAQALEGMDCAVLMLADAQAISEVLSEDAKPRIAGLGVIQMGTISPEESRQFADEVDAAGGEYLEAPVLGSTPEAQRGELIVMVGGEREAFDRWNEVLSAFGSDPLYIGPAGQAAAIKLALNQLIASLTAAFSLSLGLVQREGLEAEQFMEILRGSALYAPTFDKKLSRMLERRYDNPNFPLAHLLKDVRLFLREAGEQGLNTRVLAGCQDVLNKAVERGLGDADYSALYNAIDPPKH